MRFSVLSFFTIHNLNNRFYFQRSLMYQHLVTLQIKNMDISSLLLWSPILLSAYPFTIDLSLVLLYKNSLTDYLDDLAGRYVNGREVVSNPREDSRFGLIKRWLHYCDINHNNCQEREPPFLPTRVLDVGSKHPVLLVSEGRRGHYVALSYCWGGPQTIMTTHETFEQFTIKVDDGVSQTLKDAI